MSLFGCNPPHLVDNTDTLSGRPALTRGSVGFTDFFFFCTLQDLQFGQLWYACFNLSYLCYPCSHRLHCLIFV